MVFVLVFWHNIFFNPQLMTIHASCVILGARISSLFPRQNVMGIEVKELLKHFLFQFKPVVQTSNTSGLEYVTINFVQVSAKTTSNIIRQQTPNTKALVQNITNQTNLNKVKIVLSKIWYLNHFKKHCLVLPLTKSDDFLVGVVSFYFRKVDRNDVEVTLKVKLTKTAHNDP